MPLPTTVVGSMPKPDYLNLPSWVADGKYEKDFVLKHTDALAKFGKQELKMAIGKATKDALQLQCEAGIDVVTDGEISRDNYIFSFCRRLNGIDFSQLQSKVHRNGACEDRLPRIVGKLSRGKGKCSLADEWRETDGMSTLPVKMTLPGPMTIMDTTVDVFYGENEEDLFADIVKCLQEEIEELCGAGCRHIQIDDPVLVRYPEKALSIGLNMLNKCFAVVPADVSTTVHVCCGYPQYLDQTDYKKSDLNAYVQVLAALDEGNFKQISIEDAHRRNPTVLLQSLKKKTVVLGVVDVVNSRIETVEEIRQHILEVLEHVPKERLVIAPDCGLIYLPRHIMKAKLKNMVTAARQL